jgi:RHH-type transcriptional regulator, rel operon repressor / antitoxin RelB
MALSVRLPEEIESRLEALAQKTGRTKTFYIREAVLEHLEDLEDYYLALERIQNPEGEPVSLEDVIARLGLDDSI